MLDLSCPAGMPQTQVPSIAPTLLCLAGEKEMKIVMASLDDAGKTATLHRAKLDTAVTSIPTIGFNVESVEHHCLGALENKKTGDEIADSRPDSKLRKATFPERIEDQVAATERHVAETRSLSACVTWSRWGAENGGGPGGPPWSIL